MEAELCKFTPSSPTACLYQPQPTSASRYSEFLLLHATWAFFELSYQFSYVEDRTPLISERLFGDGVHDWIINRLSIWKCAFLPPDFGSFGLHSCTCFDVPTRHCSQHRLWHMAMINWDHSGTELQDDIIRILMLGRCNKGLMSG
jgi:hypothetical protein